MNSSIEALSHRIKFIEAVGSELETVLADFLSSPHGQAFEWDLERTVHFGTVSGRIISKSRIANGAEESETLNLRIRAHGKTDIELGYWVHDIDDKIINEGETIKIELDPDDGADDATARVLSAIMSSHGNEISRSLRRYLQAKIDPEPKAIFNQTPSR